MFAREFGYSEEHVDWAMDMDRIFAHMEYLRENPPVGTYLKSLAEAYFGSKKGKRKNNRQNSNNDYDDGGQSRPKRPKSFRNDAERLDWEQRNQRFEENQLAALKQVFGISGVVREGKKGGK